MNVSRIRWRYVNKNCIEVMIFKLQCDFGLNWLLIDVASDKDVVLSLFFKVENIIRDDFIGHLWILSEFQGKICPRILLTGPDIKDPISLVEELKLVVHFEETETGLVFVLFEVLWIMIKST